MTDIDSSIQQIEAETARVAREREEHEAAIGAERDAEAAILGRVIEDVRPALRAITDRVTRGDDDATTLTRAVRVAGGYEECDYEQRRRSTGSVSIEGEDLWLTREGQLAVIEYRGESSQWANTGAGVARTMRVVTSREAMDTYRLDAIIGNLLDALLKDKRAAATKAARERMAKLTALLALV